jgi:endonuclease YncB( thermonuclease family)
MNVVKFEPRRRYSLPWKFKRRSPKTIPSLYRPTRALELSRYRVIKYSLMVGVFALLLAASFLQRSIDTSLPLSMTATTISVVDGDTVRANGQVYRLVGFDTPEFGSLARCERERKLADTATNRLRQLIANGQSALEPVRCSCPPGTEGTRACNHGRLCAVLRAEGRDVGPILISEGLARPYMCGQTGCPKRQSWCS